MGKALCAPDTKRSQEYGAPDLQTGASTDKGSYRQTVLVIVKQTETRCHGKSETKVRDLKKAGFVDRGGKGNHRNFVHPNVR